MPDPRNLPSSSTVRPEVETVRENVDFPGASLEFIEQMLAEEEKDKEENLSMSHDPLALQAMEKSFYQVLRHEKNSFIEQMLAEEEEDAEEKLSMFHDPLAPQAIEKSFYHAPYQ